MKKSYILIVLIALSTAVKAQQYGLFNTKTMFDAFENPAQKAFTLDSSRKFVSNFFVPNGGVNFLNKGSMEYPLRKLIQEGVIDTKNVDLNSDDKNVLLQNTNVYLLAFRIYQSYKYQKELGFSWQLRADAQVNFTNQTLALFDSPQRFNNTTYIGALNNSGFAQTYHQFSMVYRENWDKKWAFGTKLSLLSGIQYNALAITNSKLQIDLPNNVVNVELDGKYKGTVINADEWSKKDLLPFKNFGFSTTLGASYTSKTGVLMMANVKDLGFIRWNKKSYVLDTNITQTITGANDADADDKIARSFTAIGRNNAKRERFTSFTNAKADFLISKTFEFYRPSLILSKNLYNRNGDVAFSNSFTGGNWSGTFTPTYNLNNFILFGLQGMYQTPNFELFLGSDNIFKTYYTVKGISKKSGDIGNGYNGGSVYFGMSLKFGYVVEHAQNMSWMPGIGNNKEGSFFKRIFGKRDKARRVP